MRVCIVRAQNTTRRTGVKLTVHEIAFSVARRCVRPFKSRPMREQATAVAASNCECVAHISVHFCCCCCHSILYRCLADVGFASLSVVSGLVSKRLNGTLYTVYVLSIVARTNGAVDKIYTYVYAAKILSMCVHIFINACRQRWFCTYQGTQHQIIHIFLWGGPRIFIGEWFSPRNETMR